MHRSPVGSLPQVHQIVLPTPWESRYVQVYLIDADPLTLIDAGLKTDEAWAALSSALESLGHGVEDIKRVVLTHYHRDHVGQVQSLRDAGAELELWAHENAVSMVEDFTVERDENIEGTAELFHSFGVPPAIIEEMKANRRERLLVDPAMCEPTRVDHVLHGRDVVGFKEFSLNAIHAPGHTACHILLQHEASGTLFTGDHVMGNVVPNTENYFMEGLPEPTDRLRRRPRFKGLLQYRESLLALRRQSFSVLLPGYGGVIRNASRAIRDSLLYYDVRIRRIDRSLRSVTALGQEVTGFELWRGMFPNDDPATEMKTRLLMVIGVLDVLEATGACLTRRGDDGVFTHTHAEPA